MITSSILFSRLVNMGLPTSGNWAERKKIKLSNIIAIFLSIASLVFGISQLVFWQDYIKGICSIVFILLVSFVYTFNYKGKYIMARAFLSTLIPSFVLFTDIVAKIGGRNMLGVSDFVSARFILVGTVVIPAMLLNISRKDKLSVVIISYNFMILFLFDQIHEFFGVGINQLGIHANNYAQVKVYQFVTWGVLLGCMALLSNINKTAEDRLNWVNKVLLQQNEKIKDQQKDLEKHIREAENQRIEIEARNKALYQSQEEIIAQHDFIEQKNHELKQNHIEIQNVHARMLDSLEYAHTIQKALMPTEEERSRILKEHFVIYWPQGIVSGDFFWMHEINKFRIVIVADCTGHGVPGAFMSMIGKTMLNDIINIRQILRPDIILYLLNRKIRSILNQGLGHNLDGMEMAIAVIKTLPNNQYEVKYAGAKMPMFLVKSGEVNRIKPTRKSIGGFQNVKRQYQLESFILDKGDMIFMLSDGYTDQMNTAYKKLGLKAWKELLMQNHNLSMEEQKQIYATYFKEHQLEEEQIDDVTIVGMRL